MTTDEAIATIPTGWRFYTCDASIIGRYSVMLRQIDHIGYVGAIGPTLADAMQTAAIKAKGHWRGWTIMPDAVGYRATITSYECGGEYENGFNIERLHGMTVENVKAEIDERRMKNSC